MQVFERDPVIPGPTNQPTDPIANLPTLDEYGLLRQDAEWVALSPIESRLIEAFLSRPGKVISRHALGEAGWPEGVPNARSVDARIKVLRRRVAPLSVQIHTVRGHGYLAEFNKAI
jgi:DNA-binding response OmpR family regulator